MKKHQFVIENISPFFKSDKDDSKFLTEDISSFSGINSRITFKKVLDFNSKLIDKDPMLMNLGNTNPVAIKYFKPFINGVSTVDNGKIFIDSVQLVKGAVIEIEYNARVIGGKQHIVPIGIPKFIGYINMDKAKKSTDKIHQLF